jgi:predicted site-specific integrase-resolvase
MDTLLTKKEVAQLLRVSERTINRYLSAGVDLGKVVLPSGVLRFDRSKVEQAVKHGRFKRR